MDISKLSQNKRRQVGAAMTRLAATNPRFSVLYKFLRDLKEYDGQEYITACRTRMPDVAEALIEMGGPTLEESAVVKSMKDVHLLTDGEVVALSAMVLDLTAKTVYKAMEDQK